MAEDMMMKKEIAKKLLGKLQDIDLANVQSLTVSLVMKGSSMEPKDMEHECPECGCGMEEGECPECGYEEESAGEGGYAADKAEDKAEGETGSSEEECCCPNCGEYCQKGQEKCPNCNCKLREGKQMGKLNMPNKHMMMKKMQKMMEEE